MSSPGIDQNHVKWLKRQAFLIVGQLPDDEADALAVLDMVRSLLVDWMPEATEKVATLQVVS